MVRLNSSGERSCLGEEYKGVLGEQNHTGRYAAGVYRGVLDIVMKSPRTFKLTCMTAYGDTLNAWRIMLYSLQESATYR